MSKHDKHDHCEHEVKYCDKCDTAYCGKCNKEWTTDPCTLNHYPWYNDTGTVTNVWPKIRYSSTSAVDLTKLESGCAHD